MTLTAAVQLLLARHSNQQDVASARSSPAVTTPSWSGSTGFFVNTLVLRSG